jgi:hypothetical protein
MATTLAAVNEMHSTPIGRNIIGDILQTLPTRIHRLPIPKPCKPSLLYLVAKSRSARIPFLQIPAQISMALRSSEYHQSRSVESIPLMHFLYRQHISGREGKAGGEG